MNRRTPKAFVVAHSLAVAIAALLSLASQPARAECDNAKDLGYTTYDDDAQGRRGLNAQIACLTKAYAASKSDDLRDRLAAAKSDLESRKKIWTYEGGGAPNYDPTVVCDGKGGMRPALFGHGEEFGKGFAMCLYRHERIHIRDFLATCPNWCKGKAPGTIAPYLAANMPKDVSDYMLKQCPAWKDPHGYTAWSNNSECKAYSEQVKCTLELDKKGGDDYKAAMKKGREGHADFKARSAKMVPPVECPPLPDEIPPGGALKTEAIVPNQGDPKTPEGKEAKSVPDANGKAVGTGGGDAKGLGVKKIH